MDTRNGGLQHAYSLGNISSSKPYVDFRSYDSEDENMGRIRSAHSSLPRTSVYSKGDIREQYCLSDRQLNSIEPPRRDRFFGCLSGRSAPQSFLGVCVGRRAPSDENLTDYAPVYKHPRYPHPGSTANSNLLLQEDESSYFRRKPTSFVSSHSSGRHMVGGGAGVGGSSSSCAPIDPKRYNWLSAADDEDSVRMEGPRSIRPDINVVGPYMVGSPAYPLKPSNKPSILSQSSDHLNGVSRCPTHSSPAAQSSNTGISNIVPQNNVLNNDGSTIQSASHATDATPVPRIKHVSFARSHTLTSFDEASSRHVHYGQPPPPQLPMAGGMAVHSHNVFAHPSSASNRPQNSRLGTPTRTQERLIGGKNPTLTIQPTTSAQFILQQTSLQMPPFGHSSVLQALPPLQQIPPPQQPHSDVFIVEKAKRNMMKSQATQTDKGNQGKVVGKQSPWMSSTPDPIDGRKLTKSLSEAANRSPNLPNISPGCYKGTPRCPTDHENLCRTFSEEPPRSPFESSLSNFHSSRTPSRQSNFTDMQSKSNGTQHTRNPSAESGSSFMSSEYSSKDSVVSFKAETEMFDQRAEDYEKSIYDTHSLPRKSCIHHRTGSEQRHTHSLPRRDGRNRSKCKHGQNSESLPYVDYQDYGVEFYENQNQNQNICAHQRRMSYSVVKTEEPAAYVIPRRNSVHQSSYQRPMFDDLLCSRFVPSYSDGDTQTQEEKEIFIDFKPRLSPPSPSSSRKRGLLKTRSEGEILIDRRRDSSVDAIFPSSQSEEDLLKSGGYESLDMDQSRFHYQGAPIKDEGIFRDQMFFAQSGPPRGRDHFRKRSISLEDPQSEMTRSGGDFSDEIREKSGCASTDSVSTDATKEHTDSQVTVVNIESVHKMSPPKQHQQHQQQRRMSEINQPVNYPEITNPSPQSTVSLVRPLQTITRPVIPPGSSLISGGGADNKVRAAPEDDSAKIDPLAAAGPGTKRGNNTDISECSTNTEDYVTCTDNSKRIWPVGPISATTASQLPVSSSASYRSAAATVDGSSFESASSVYGMPTSLGAVLAAKASAMQSMTATSSSVDEAVGSGGTMTSKRVPGSRSSSPHSSSSDTFNNSNSNLPLPPTPQPGVAKTGKIVTPNKELPIRIKGSPSRTNVVTPVVIKHIPSVVSLSEDEDQVKPGIRHGTTTSNLGLRSSGKSDWNEEDRRKKKGNLKLDFDIGSTGSVAGSGKLATSPKTKISTTFKKISPDDRTALNILDGASPSKSKRYRPKPRRSPRNRSSSGGGDELITPTNRRPKVNFTKSPTAVVDASTYHIPLEGDLPKTPSLLATSSNLAPPTKLLSPNRSSPKKNGQGGKSDLKLKALSTESLRSVSPGSDSVFYSEADLTMEHQVQCHHCGKEVDIVTAGPDSMETVRDGAEMDRPEIVQPPAGFADSPNVTKPARLYKKVDKRFRSEERHGDRRHHRNRSDTRAKSEERGKDETSTRGGGGSSTIRPAGSSPCVGVVEFKPPTSHFDQQIADPEQGIYHGVYRLGVWICIANQDVYKRPELSEIGSYELGERRGSTESEKDFRKKYQALTHRLVHRRSCIEMYKRGNSLYFSGAEAEADTVRGRLQEIIRLMCMVWAKQGIANRLISGGKENAADKTVVVSRESGEFGFRIHGSKPVVVSAIESNTPAESSGLEVGDIVLAVNGTSVIDKSHSEVVKIAHAGSDTLTLDVARTIDIMHANNYDNTALYSGYLWRTCGYASGHPNTAKKWVRRWFTLRPDHCLYFYKSENENQPVGAILLTNHTVERCGSEITRPFAFKIDDNENPILFLAGDSEEATNRWVAIMSHAAKQMDPWLEMSTKNLRLAPLDVPRPDCFGYLMKLGNRWRSWTNRYCVLKDACLYFYQDGKSRNAFGMTCLQGYRVQPSSNCGGKKFAFEITPPEPKLRHYYFATESEIDKKRWIVALEYSIDRWMKAG